MATAAQQYKLRISMQKSKDKKVIKAATSTPLKRRKEYKEAIARQAVGWDPHKVAGLSRTKKGVESEAWKKKWGKSHSYIMSLSGDERQKAIAAAGKDANFNQVAARHQSSKRDAAEAKRLAMDEASEEIDRGGKPAPKVTKYSSAAKGMGLSEGHVKKLVAQYDKEVGPAKKQASKAAAVVAKGKGKARAKSGTKRLGPAPPLPKDWRTSLKMDDPIRKRYRDWAAGKLDTRKAVAKGTPATSGVPRGKASEAADKSGLAARIAMKQKNNEPIPKSWQKKMAARDVRAGVEAAGRRIRGTVLVGSQREKDQKAKIKGATAGMREIMKTISPKARARYAKGKKIASDQAANRAYAKEGAADKSRMRKAETEGVALEAGRGKREAAERIANVRADAAKRKKAQGQANLEAAAGLPGLGLNIRNIGDQAVRNAETKRRAAAMRRTPGRK